MNREIKFRGKSLHTGEWHYGNLMQVGDACYIHEPGTAGFFTDPETVGQFTELYDCKGNGIYDGDILGAKGKVIGWVKGGVRGYVTMLSMSIIRQEKADGRYIALLKTTIPNK